MNYFVDWRLSLSVAMGIVLGGVVIYLISWPIRRKVARIFVGALLSSGGHHHDRSVIDSQIRNYLKSD
jgi:hypothetical protein